MLTHSGRMELGTTHELEVLAATSFTDLERIANPEPIIGRQPELFVGEWQGGTEVVAVIDERRIAAAAALRYRSPDKKTLEAYVVGEVEPSLDPRVLRDIIRARIEQRRTAMDQPVHTTVYWGKLPPEVPSGRNRSTVGRTGYRQASQQAHEKSRQQFLEDLASPYKKS